MTQKSTLLATTVFAVSLLSILQAQPFYAAGEYNGWDPGANVMNDNGDGSYSLTIFGFTPGALHEWKITDGTWDSTWPPPNNAKSKYDASGSFTFNFRSGVVNDGWNPQANRAGYVDPGNMSWELMGAFNNWDDGVDKTARQMSDMGNGLYTVDYPIALPGTNEFKFRSPGVWDYAVGEVFNSDGPNATVITTESNQVVTFQLDLPNGRWLAGEPAAAPTNQVAFVVDMQYPIYLYDQDFSDPNGFETNSEKLYVRGSFNGFAVSSDAQLFQIPGTTLYSNTVEVVGYTGATISYKFWKDFGDGAYEDPLLSCGGDRMLELTGVSPQEAPLSYWSDRMVSDPTCSVRFSVDMSVQQLFGNFDASTNTVLARGTFNNFGDTFVLTNDPGALNPNVYSGVMDIVSPIGGCIKYKYFIANSTVAPNGGWESPSSTDGNDRQFNISSTNQELAVLYFNDQSICDLIEETNYVTFSIDMANATGTDAMIYDGTQTIYINGDFLGWKSQTDGQDWGPNPKPELALTKDPSSDVHSITMPMPPGNSLKLIYKYTMTGPDNEAASGNNHVRYIRTDAGSTNYTMPMDVWINTNPGAQHEESELGGLTALPSTPGNVQIDWQGLKCASMQTTTNVTSGPWMDLFDAQGVGSTNLQTTEGQQFFRMFRP